MAQERLEYCPNNCCHFVDGKAVTNQEYEAARARHPGSYVGIQPGQRNATLETKVKCRSVQIFRIRDIVKQLCESCNVEFDTSKGPGWIRFRISNHGTPMTKAWPEFRSSDVAEWSDDKIKQTIESVTNGLVR